MNSYIIKSFSYRLLEEEIGKITKNSTNVITFDLDESIEYGARIENILNEIMPKNHEEGV